jgi:Protein of unknown function (DUF1045)
MLNCAHLDTERKREAAKDAAPCRAGFPHYAISFTPRPGTALAAFGRSWFGRANDGVTLQAFSDAGLPGSGFAKIPAAPGRYTGLHALFKAPFALRDGVRPEALKSQLADFTSRLVPVATGPLTLARAGRCLVLRPVESKPALERLSADCAKVFEGFAAPPTEAIHDDDANPHLSDHQRALLRSLSRPRPLREQRFQIALTGPLSATHLDRVTQALWPVLEEICAAGVTVDGLSLFGDTGGASPMHLVGRYRLGA